MMTAPATPVTMAYVAMASTTMTASANLASLVCAVQGLCAVGGAGPGISRAGWAREHPGL